MGKIYDALEKFKTETAAIPAEAGIGMNAVKDETNLSFHVAVSDEPLHPNITLDPNLVVYHDPFSYAAEQFKILRTRLLFPLKGDPPRTVMITSAMQGEGKSFSTANLAISIAQGINDHVLLIDCDMRSSTQQKLFGFGSVKGLSHYLRDRAELEDILLKTPIEKLTLLPGGKIPPNPSELLSSHRMSELLVEVKERYDDRFIIIDSSPPQLTAETNALASQVDGIIIVMSHLKTPRSQVDKLVEKLGRDKILGILLNRFEKPLKEYYGYHTYRTGGSKKSKQLQA